MSEWTWQWRMIVRGWFRESWIDATPNRREEIFAAWLDVHRRWQALGCRLILTMDDVSVVGRPTGSHCNFYSVWEIPRPDVIRDLLEPVWDEHGREPVRLAEYFSLETVVGKPILTMETELGGALLATPPGKQS